MNVPGPLVLATDHAALRRIRPWLQQCLPDIDPSVLGGIELAVHELAANSVDHSDTSERVTLTADRRPSQLMVELRDGGKAFDPAGVARPDPDVPDRKSVV